MNVTITINVEAATVGSHMLRPGTVAGDWRIEVQDLTDPSVVLHSYVGSKPSARFDLPKGQQVQVRGCRLDDQGAPLGAIVVLQFTVGDAQQQIDLAKSIDAA